MLVDGVGCRLRESRQRRARRAAARGPARHAPGVHRSGELSPGQPLHVRRHRSIRRGRGSVPRLGPSQCLAAPAGARGAPWARRGTGQVRLGWSAPRGLPRRHSPRCGPLQYEVLRAGRAEPLAHDHCPSRSPPTAFTATHAWTTTPTTGSRWARAARRPAGAVLGPASAEVAARAGRDARPPRVAPRTRSPVTVSGWRSVHPR